MNRVLIIFAVITLWRVTVDFWNGRGLRWFVATTSTVHEVRLYIDLPECLTAAEWRGVEGSDCYTLSRAVRAPPTGIETDWTNRGTRGDAGRWPLAVLAYRAERLEALTRIST